MAMMIKIRKIRPTLFLLSAICLLFLSGCVSLVQEITVLDDGSGTLRFSIGVENDQYDAFVEGTPDGFRLENLFEPFSRDENVTMVRFDHYTEGNLTWDTVEMTITDFTAVFGQMRRIGPMRIEFVAGDDDYRFTQTIDVANSPLVIPGVNLMDLSRATSVVTLSTPQIIGTNGLQTASGVSTWSIPMEEVLQGGSTAFLRSNFMLDPFEGVFIPWEVFFPYVVIGFLGLGGISVFIIIIFNTVIRRDKEPTLKFK